MNLAYALLINTLPCKSLPQELLRGEVLQEEGLEILLVQTSPSKSLHMCSEIGFKTFLTGPKSPQGPSLHFGCGSVFEFGAPDPPTSPSEAT